MIDDGKVFLIPHRQHLPGPWHLPSWAGAAPLLWGAGAQGTFPPGGWLCAWGRAERGNPRPSLSPSQSTPACFHGVRRLNVQCRCNALGKEGMGPWPWPWPWPPREAQPLPASAVASVYQTTCVFFLSFFFFRYNSIKQLI